MYESLKIDYLFKMIDVNKTSSKFFPVMHSPRRKYVEEEKNCILRHVPLIFCKQDTKPARTHLQFTQRDSLHVINLIKMGHEKRDLDKGIIIWISRR